jgi:hypothetical protein
MPPPVSHPSSRRSSPLTPPSFTPALHSAALRPSCHRSSSRTPPRFTLALDCAALHPSFRRPHPSLPTLNPSASCRRPSVTLHTAALHFSLPHPSLPPIIAPPCTLLAPALHPSLPHPSLPPLTAPPFTLHSAALSPSYPHHSPPPFTAPPVTHPSAVLHPSLRHAPLWSSTLPPFTPTLHYTALHPAALHSTALYSGPAICHSSLPALIPTHRERPFVELQLVQQGENSDPAFSLRATVAIREATNPSTERRTATCNHLLVEQNSYQSPSLSVTDIRHAASYYSDNWGWNVPSQASRRATTAPPSTKDRHRPPADPITFNRHPATYGSHNCP